MDTQLLVAAIAFAISITIVSPFAIRNYYHIKNKEKQEGEEKQKSIKRKEEEEKKYKKSEKKYIAMTYFGVKLGKTPESKSKAYDEIVRLVNLEALQTAKACVHQDKANREKTNQSELEDVNNEVYDLKKNWAFLRKQALKISTSLKDRIPHFSEFEPLKNYREEHILQKKNQSK